MSGKYAIRYLRCCAPSSSAARRWWPAANAVDEAQRYAAADDPVAISDLKLDRVFSQGVAEREIRAALTAGDLDLAQSFLDLAAERSV